MVPRSRVGGGVLLVLAAMVCSCGSGWCQLKPGQPAARPPELDAICTITATTDKLIKIHVDYKVTRSNRPLTLRGRAIVNGLVASRDFTSTTPAVQPGAGATDVVIAFQGTQPVKVDELWIELMAGGIASPLRYAAVPYGKLFPAPTLPPGPGEPTMTPLIMTNWRINKPSPNEVRVKVDCDTRLVPGSDLMVRAEVMASFGAAPGETGVRLPDTAVRMVKLAEKALTKDVALDMVYRGTADVEAAGVRLSILRTGQPVPLQQVDADKPMQLRAPGPDEVVGTGNSLWGVDISQHAPSQVTLSLHYKLAAKPDDFPGGFMVRAEALTADGNAAAKLKGRNIRPIKEAGTGAVAVFIKYLGTGGETTEKLRFRLVGFSEQGQEELLAQTTFAWKHKWQVETDVMMLSLGKSPEVSDVSLCSLVYAYHPAAEGKPALVTALPCKDGVPQEHFTSQEVTVKRTGCANLPLRITFVGGNYDAHVGNALPEYDTDGILVRFKDKATGATLYEELFERPRHWKLTSHLRLTALTRKSPWDLEATCSAVPGPESFYQGKAPRLEVRMYGPDGNYVYREAENWEEQIIGSGRSSGTAMTMTYGIKLHYKGTEDIAVSKLQFALCNDWERGPSKAFATVDLNVDTTWPSSLMGFIPGKYGNIREEDLVGRTTPAPKPLDYVPVWAHGKEYRCYYDSSTALSGSQTGKPYDTPIAGEYAPLRASDVVAVVMPNRPGLLNAEKLTVKTRDDAGNQLEVYKLQHCTFRWLGSIGLLDVHVRWRTRGIPKQTVRVRAREAIAKGQGMDKAVAENDIVWERDTNAVGDCMWQPIPRGLLGHQFRVEVITLASETGLLSQVFDMPLKEGYNEVSANLVPDPAHTGMVAAVKFGRCECYEAQEVWGDDVYVATTVYQAYGDKTLEGEARPKLLTSDSSKIFGFDEFMLIEVDREQQQVTDDQMLYLGDPGCGGLKFNVTVWDEDSADHKQENAVWQAVDDGLKAIPYVGQILSIASEVVRIIWDAFGDDDDVLDTHEYVLTPDQMGAICDKRDFCLRKGKPGEPGADEPLTQNKNLWGGKEDHEWEFTGDSAWGADYRYTMRMHTIVLPAWASVKGFSDE